MEAAAACPKCGAVFQDPSGQLAQFVRMVRDGKLALMIGCTSCRLLFVPHASAGVAETVLGTDARAPQSSPLETLPAGSRYRTVRKLGEGGMGVTYLAIDQFTQRRVCVKQLHAHCDARALRQEWKALAALDHPSIVRLLDFYEDSGRSHLVMDFVDGVPLDRIERLPEPVALDVVGQLCEAVAVIHARDVIHRDIKPGNILIEWDGTRAVPRIVDFGIAIVNSFDAYAMKTGAGAVAGTPYYMSPEQFRAVEVTPSVDVFALGMTLAQMLVGIQAISAGSLADLVNLRTATDGFRLAAGSCSPHAAELVFAMTRRDPAARITASAAAEWIRRMLPAVHAPELLAAVNLDASRLDATGAPVGWCNGLGFVDGVSTAYRIGANQKQLVIAAPANASELFGTAMQRVACGHLAGGRVRFSGQLAADGCTSASLWVRIDTADGRQLVFDNMSERALRGSVGFTPCSIEVAVPSGAAWLNYGVLLIGSGQVHARSLELHSPGTTVSFDLQ